MNCRTECPEYSRCDFLHCKRLCATWRVNQPNKRNSLKSSERKALERAREADRKKPIAKPAFSYMEGAIEASRPLPRFCKRQDQSLD